MKLQQLAACSAFLLAPFGADAASLTTTFVGGNNAGVGSMVYFDLDVLDPLGVTITGFAVNFNEDAPAGTYNLAVYTRTGTFVGNVGSSSGWTLAASGSGTGTPTAGSPFAMTLTAPLALSAGITGFAMRSVDYRQAYTTGANTYSNADLSFTAGAADTTPGFRGGVFTPRTWNGTIQYEPGSPVPEPSTMILVSASLAGLALLRRRR